MSSTQILTKLEKERLKQSEMKKYAQVSLYDEPPTADVSLENFESFALDRIRMLTSIENWIASGKKQDEIVQLITEKERQLDLLARNEKDEVSHFALRLAFCRTESLRRQFLLSETMLFKARFQQMQSEQKAKFIKNELGYKNIEREEFDEIAGDLKTVVWQTRQTKEVKAQNANEKHNRKFYYKVQFEKVHGLVKSREVLVKKGNAFVHESQVDAIVMTEFRAKLLKNLGLAAKRWNTFVESEERARLVPIINSLRTKELARQDYANGGSNGATGGPGSGGIVLNKDLKNLADASFPLCAKNLFTALKGDHHLRHEGRRQLQLFLKGIGLPLEEAMVFFKTEFTKKPGCTSEKFEKDYGYGVRHSYGKEGKRVDYTPHSCMKCIAANPGKGEYHGCPFKTFSEDALSTALLQMKIEPAKVSTIVKKAKDKHYQVACSDVFEALHDGKFIEDGLQHPNQYYEESRKILQPKLDKNENDAPVMMDTDLKKPSVAAIPV